MTKHLRFLIVLLMTLVWSAGWAAESVYKTLSFPDDNKAKNKSLYSASPWTAKIGSDSWSIVYFSNNNWNQWTYIRCGNKTSASKATITNTTAFDKAITKVVVNASEIKDVAKINSIKLETSKQANFSSIVETVTLEQKSIKQGDLTFELSAPIENGYYRLTFDCQKTTSSKNGNIKVEQVDYYIDDSKASTTITFPKQSLTYAITDDLASFTGQAATLTAEATTLTGKTITYSKTGDEIFSSFDTTNGTLVLNGKAGTAKIAATFAGDDSYAAASAEYTLNVIDPNKTDFAFDFTKPESYGYAKPVSGDKTDLSNGDVLVSGSVTITNEKGASTTTRFKDDSGNVTFRVYTGAILTVEVPAGFAINRIDFTDDGTHKVDNFTFSTGELNLNTWTGLTKKLTMKVTNAQVFLKNMTVNLVKVENVTLNESADNTLEAKTGVNVTLKRSMVENEWNTICLPFNVTAEQAKTAFGEGVMIAQLNKNSSGNKLSFSSVDAIVASTPYLIKPTIAAPADGYKFEGVTIRPDGKGNVAPNFVDTNSYLAFVGIYNTVDVTNNVIEVLNNNYYAAFLGANNTIFKAKNDGGKMKGFRAYFAIPNNVAASALCVMVNGTTTSIKSINGAVVESNAPVYNLQGQRVDGNNLTPGIYVKAGKKFVVR
mgnify:CR=1 FL=1